MTLKQEAGGCQRLHVLGTALDFIDLPAGATLEMMMMGLRGSLIARRLTGQLNLDEPPFCHESFEGAIDRRNPQARCIHLCDLEYLLRTQRTPSFFNNAPDGLALRSITCHGKMVHRSRHRMQYSPVSWPSLRPTLVIRAQFRYSEATATLCIVRCEEAWI